jgi:hypothetical protein
VTRLQADRLIGQEIGVELPDEAGDFSSTKHPEYLWCPPSLILSMEVLLPRTEWERSEADCPPVLVPRLSTHGFIPPVPTCCHGVELYLAKVQL